MKTLPAFAVMILLFVHFAQAQVPKPRWTGKMKFDRFEQVTRFYQGPEEDIYRVVGTPNRFLGGLAPMNFSIYRLNPGMKTVAEADLELEVNNTKLRLLGIIASSEDLMVFAWGVPQDSRKMVLYTCRLNKTTLKSIEDFSPFAEIQDVNWRTSDLMDPPIIWKMSEGSQYFLLTIDKEDEHVVVAFNSELELIWEEEYGSREFITAEINAKGFAYIVLKEEPESRRDNSIYEFHVVDVEDGNSQVHSIPQANSANFVIRKGKDSERFLAGLIKDKDQDARMVLMDPETMEKPLIAEFKDVAVDHLSDRDQRKTEFDPSDIKFLDVHKLDNGSLIVTYEATGLSMVTSTQSSPTGQPGSSVSTTTTKAVYRRDDIYVTCFGQDGEIEWHQTVPKIQAEDELKWLSAVVIHTGEGLHLLFNDGSKNAGVRAGDDPKPWRSRRGGDPVISMVTISYEGELRKKVYYNLSKAKMWMHVQSSGLASDKLLILRLTMRKKEMLGKVRLGE